MEQYVARRIAAGVQSQEFSELMNTFVAILWEQARLLWPGEPDARGRLLSRSRRCTSRTNPQDHIGR